MADEHLLATSDPHNFLMSVGGHPVALSSFTGNRIITEQGWNFGRWYSIPEQERFLSTLTNPTFAQAAPHLANSFIEADNKDIFFWDIEEKVLGKRLPAWNQGSIGSCVSHGSGRAAQDLLLAQIALGNMEEFPKADYPDGPVCREAIYGGSRVQAGHDGGGGDGSVGAWAAQWLKEYGIILYQKYTDNGLNLDLTNGYNIDRCRQWGRNGCPKELESVARIHPIKETTLITSQSQLNNALINLYSISICGSLGRTMQRQPGGWCPVQGTWEHCQEICGVCVVKGSNNPNSPFGGDGAAPWSGDTVADIYRNSWGDYLGSNNNQILLASGKTITLPPGCYLSHPEEVERDLRQQDTFAYSHASGWPAQSLNWLI